MKLNDQQRKELWLASTGAFNHHGAKPFRVLRSTKKQLKVAFGWEQILVRVITEVVIRLIEKWMEGKLQAVNPHDMPADFCLDDLTEDGDE